jgi:tetratricopeptide (TPR) repeat protein
MILAMPIGLHLDRSIVISRSFTDLKVLCGLVLFCAILYIVFRLRKTKGPVFIGLAWFLLTYIPVSNLIIPLNTFVAENWIQLPAIGLFLALTSFAFDHSRHGLKTLFSTLSVFSIAVILFYAALTIARNNDYYNPITFYEQNLKYEPKNVSSLYLLGREYAAKGEVVKAAELYNNAMAIDPANSNSINNLANIYAQKNDYAKAISLYRQALRADPENIMVLNNLAITYARISDVTNAINCWEKSLKLDPGQPSIRQYIDFYREDGSSGVVIRKVP